MKLSTSLVALGIVMALAGNTGADTGDLSTAIEVFMSHQFPDAHRYFWVVNATQWQTEREVVIDVNTVVTPRPGQEPTEKRFLLLVVEGELKGAQNIPLDSLVDCTPERT